jgi:hypothetical protein
MVAYGIYGYWFTKQYTIGDLTFVPRITDYSQLKTERGNKRSAYALGGIVTAPEHSEETYFDLSGVLTLLSQCDVLLTDPYAVNVGNTHSVIDEFPNELRIPRTRESQSPLLLDDVFAPNSHQHVASLLLEKLSDATFCEATKFRQLLFKAAETYRQRQNDLDINYFLLFSGLEAYARACQSAASPTRDVAVPIAAQLRTLGFNILADNVSDPIRAVRTYSTLRNALFHEAELNSEVKGNHPPAPVSMSDFYSPFSTLVLFATLRAAGVNDGRVNWDGWVTKQWH